MILGAYTAANQITWNGDWSSPRLTDLGEEIQQFNEPVKATFHEHYNSGSYTLKFYFLDHMVEDVQRCESLEMLDGSPF